MAVSAMTPSTTEVDSVENFHSERRLRYEDDRDESNRFLKRASTISGIILINHVISAIDAARVARARAAGADEAALRGRTRLVLVMQPWVRGARAHARGVQAVGLSLCGAGLH